MADRESMQQAACAQCGAAFLRPAQRYVIRYCSRQCRELERAQNRKAAAKVRHKTCRWCARTYEWKYGAGAFRGCCSAECQRQWFNRIGRNKLHGGYFPPSRKRPKQPKPCEHCGMITTRPRFCSVQCSLVARDRRNGVQPIMPERKRCGECGCDYTTRARHQRYCTTECRRRVSDRKRNHIRRVRTTVDAIEDFDPIEVLMRDGWRCHLCGASTPRRLRGTHHDRAPEVDHIIPLAAGGEHSRMNTACACRRCNIMKSDRPLGQLRLVA